MEADADRIVVAELLDFLRDWLRAPRRRQDRLLLVSAHSAKGLEFDHVVVLDGGWAPSRGDDPDAPRRLFYVAMTRARQSLTLMRMSDRHAILDGLPPDESILSRRPPPTHYDQPTISQARRRLDMTEVDLGFAGRLSSGHPALTAIAALGVGDPLPLTLDDGKWVLFDASGNPVGRLSNKWRLPKDRTVVEARVHAVISRSKNETDQAWAHAMKRQRWEVVLPELVLGRLPQAPCLAAAE